MTLASSSGWRVRDAARDNTPDAHLQVYSEVLYRIRAEYVEEPNMPMVTSGALHGLLESLDANSSYLSPAEYAAFKQAKKEGRANIGAFVSKRFGYAAVVAVIPGGPADRAGISSGDIIEGIDGKDTHDMSLAEVRRHLSGASQSQVECTIIAVRKIEPKKVTVVRAAISPPALQQRMLAGDIGYIKPVVLTKGKAREIAAAIESLAKQHAGKLILDLRDAAESDEEEGVALANFFLDHGTIAYLQGQKFNRVTFTADPHNKITDLQLMLLVNHGTAGAAELTAAAILENARGDVVGDKTFGDGSVQKIIEASNGAALILSIAKYYTPRGKVIQENGITPNVEVASAEELAILPDEEDGAADKADLHPKRRPPSADEQLQRAIEILRSKPK